MCDITLYYNFWRSFIYLKEVKLFNMVINHISVREGGAAGGWESLSIRAKIILSFGQRRSTHVKISQLVASLQTSRQQVVFARLVTSCQQVWNKLLTTCNNLVDIVRLVARLFQQDCYNHDITILLQPCVVNLVIFLLYHACIRLVRTTL